MPGSFRRLIRNLRIQREQMVKTLSKDILARRDQLMAALDDAETEVSGAIERFNATLEDAAADVHAAVAAYNELVQDARSLVEEAGSAVGEYYEDRSEKWQVSDKGQAYDQWRTNLIDLGLDEIEVEIPDPIGEPSFDARAVLSDEFPADLPE